MPTYDYQCQTCGQAFEVYQSFTDDSIPKCPGREAGTCKSRGKGKVTKILSAPAIAFKGSGFYKNDSRSGSAKSSDTSASSSETKSESSSSSSSESSSSDTKSEKKPDKKPEKKAESKPKSDSKSSSSATSGK